VYNGVLFLVVTIKFGIFILEYVVSVTNLNIIRQRPRAIGWKYQVAVKSGLEIPEKMQKRL